jgi:hypothetical protein
MCSIKPKVLNTGAVNGSTFADLIVSFVDAINSKSLPVL